MKNEYDKMTSGELYDYTAPETSGSWFACRERLRRFNSEMPYGEGYRAALRELIPSIPDTTAIYPPFQCDHGTPIKIGEYVVVNMNCVFLDGGGISIGDHTLIGPSCGLYTPQHPIDYIERRPRLLARRRSYGMSGRDDRRPLHNSCRKRCRTRHSGRFACRGQSGRGKTQIERNGK